MATGTIKSVIPRSDIVDNLTTNDSTKVLSAAQGNALSEHIGKNNVKTLTPGTNVSSYENATIATENPYSKIAFVNLYLTASASIGAGNVLCSGLPIPAKVVFAMAADYDGNNTYTTVPCYVNTSGYFVSRATFTNGHTLLVTMVYLIA